MAVLYDPVVFIDHHCGNSINFVDDNFKIVEKLLKMSKVIFYRDGINLPTNADSIAAILIAIHRYDASNL